MAIATLPTTDTTAEIVYSLDPDVTPKNGSVGWILATDATIKTGADVLEVRPLNIDERSASLDVDGLHSSMVARCRRGLVSVNGHKKRRAIDEFLTGCPTEAVFLLGCYVASVTAGEDPQLSQRAYFGEEDEDSAPEGD
jgi:hypothetical protein